MTIYNINELKDLGFMRQGKSCHYVLRIKLTGGTIAAEALQAVKGIAEEYGNNTIHLTSRQSLEIPYIHADNIGKTIEAMETAGLKSGACGSKVRSITACQGSPICSSGLIDSQKLARTLDDRYFGRKLPHKMKIGVTGCKNNCMKAEQNDIGIKGAMSPTLNKQLCTYCGACEKACRDMAITVDKTAGTLVYDREVCTHCGRCVKLCPTSALTGDVALKVYFGGIFGNRIESGKQLLPILHLEDELLLALDTALDFFEKHGKTKERFIHTLDRIGWNVFEEALNEAFKRK